MCINLCSLHLTGGWHINIMTDILILVQLVNSYKTITKVIKGCRKEGKYKILVVDNQLF